MIPLPSPLTLEKALPFPSHLKQSIHHFRKAGENILRGDDERLVIFAGPCSIHDQEIALQYAHHLKEAAKKVEERIFLIMRVFLEKPRTQFGWKGYVYDPTIDGTYEMEDGLYQARELLLKLAACEIPMATEFLDPFLLPYHQDFFTWGVVGARTSASQIHRQMASQLPLPIGFKNETDGTLDNAICGALTARHPQALIGMNQEGFVCKVQAQGNPYTHLVLRGALDYPNYDAYSISEAIHRQRVFGLNAPLIVDCSHGNSGKHPQKQIDVFHSVLDQMAEGNHVIAGAMLESHLQEGNALSITDPCLNWKQTEELIFEAYSMLTSVLCAKNF